MNLAAYLRQFFLRNGVALGTFLLVAVTFWILLMILLPQIFMIDFSLRPNLPPAAVGGPQDVYTLEHVKFMLYGS